MAAVLTCRARRTLNLGADSDCSSLQTSSDSGVLPPLGCSRSAEDLRLSTDRLFRSSSGQLMCLARSADWSQGAALQRKRSVSQHVEELQMVANGHSLCFAQGPGRNPTAPALCGCFWRTLPWC